MKKIRRLIALHGYWGALKVLAGIAMALILWWTPKRIRVRAAWRKRDQEFDQIWGVDTSGKAVPDKTDIVGSNWVFGSTYEGAVPEDLVRTLNDLNINFDDYTFVDFGSGKGRAVLIASRLPFSRVIGVEYCKAFHETAQRNLDIFPKSEIRSNSVELYCADATQFKIPSGPVVVYLNNPFQQTLMTQVVQNVTRSFEDEPRSIIVVYVFAKCVDLWQDTDFLVEVIGGKKLTVFKTRDLVPEFMAESDEFVTSAFHMSAEVSSSMQDATDEGLIETSNRTMSF